MSNPKDPDKGQIKTLLYPLEKRLMLDVTISQLVTTLTVQENSAPAIVDSVVQIAGSSKNYAANNDILTISSTAPTEDIIGVINTGVGGDALVVSGSNVTYGGAQLATFAGGNGSNLVFTFNNTGNIGTAAMQRLFESITYGILSDNPTTSRTLTFTVSGGDSATSAVAITVTPEPDAPAGTDKTIALLEDNSYTLTTADFGFSDGDGNTLLNVKISTLPTAGSLKLNGVAVTVGQSVLASDITANKLVFTPVTNANGTGYSAFTFQVQDNSGLSPDTDPSANTITFNVTSVNDAPAGTDKTVTMLEDASYTFATSDFGFSDTNDSPANTLLAVKITTLPGAGTLKLNGVAVTTGQSVLATDITANKLVYTPVANANGTSYSAFTFQVQDNGGTASTGVDLDQSANTITFNVTAVNDAPAGTDTTISAPKNGSYAFVASDFGFSDTTDGNSFLAVKITQLPTVGTFKLSGVTVTLNQVISVANVSAGNLVYTPIAGQTGNNYDNFKFAVEDDGGTANSGVDFDQSPNTMTINVAILNSPPAGTDKTVTILEEGTYTFATADFGFSDPGDTPANNFSGVKISTLPGAGTIKLSGTAVTLGQIVTVANINSGLLTYTPGANGNGTGYSSFTFAVQDDGGTANGGKDLDQTPNTFTFNVTSVNDAPDGTDKTITFLEDNSYTLTTADFGFADASDSPANTLLAVKISTLPGAGTLKLNGVAVTAGQSVLATDIAANKLVYTPVANANGTGYSAFTFQVQDDGGTANSGFDLDQSANTITFNVTSVNDAPTLTTMASTVVTVNEDTQAPITLANLKAQGDEADVDGTVEAFVVKAVSTGTLLIGTSAGTATAWAAGTNDVINASTSAGTATAWAAGTNDVINATRSAFWTGAPNANGTLNAFTVVARDNNGADSALPAVQVQVNVTSVNDAPTGLDKTITMLEDATYSFTGAEFGFTDADDSSANAFTEVTITTLPTAGTLTLNSVAVTAGQSVLASDIAANLLVFTPVANGNGVSYATFTFQVQDDGGTANGGVDLDQTANTITFNVTSVNDEPAGADKTITTLEDMNYAFTASDFGLTDGLDSPADTLSAVTITALPLNGTLKLNGVAVTIGQSVSVANINSGLLVFTPASNASGTGYANFTFQVQDSGGTANGGDDFAASSNAITLDVVALNDAPDSADKTVTTLEDTAYIFVASDFSFTDANDSPANVLTSVKITTLPTAGTLKINGVAVTADQSISLTDITGGLLIYTPGANGNGAGYASFTFQVQDDGGTANTGSDTDQIPNTFSFDVTPVNDPPTDISLSREWFPIGSQTGDLVAKLSTADPDNDNSSLTYSIVGSPSIFTLVGDQLRLTSTPNFKTDPRTYTVTIRTDDGQYTFDKTFTITMGNETFVPPDELPGNPGQAPDTGLPAGMHLDAYTPIHDALTQIHFGGTGGGNERIVATSFLAYGKLQINAFYGARGISQSQGAVADADMQQNSGAERIFDTSLPLRTYETLAEKQIVILEQGSLENAYAKPPVKLLQEGVEEWVKANQDNPLFKAIMLHKAGQGEAAKTPVSGDHIAHKHTRNTSLQLDEAALYYQSKQHKLIEALMKKEK